MSQEGSNTIREDNNGPTGATPPSPDPFQPKKQSKLIRILTVIAYMLSVSMAAIFLSAYYIFMYDAQPTLAQTTYPVPNALTQGPNFHQYEQYVYIKEKKILKDKGLLTSNLVKSSVQSTENNTGENLVDINNKNNTDSLIDNQINVENNLFETGMHDNDNNISDSNNIGFSLYRLYKRAMEGNKKENGNGKMEQSGNVSNPAENDINLENNKSANKTKDSSDREHVPKAIITLIQALQITPRIPIKNNINEDDSNINGNMSNLETVFSHESNIDYENNSTDVNLEQLLLNISDTINKEY